MKVRLYVLLIALFIGVCGILLLLSAPKVQVVGNIPKEDLAQIKTVVQRFTEKRILERTGRGKFWELLKYHFSRPIIQIEVQTNGTVTALFPETAVGDCGYDLSKEPSGWNVKATIFH